MLAESLTDREREILALIAEGYTNREIAAQLFLTYRTVKWYNTQIYRKLGVSNREQAVEQAQALGLLDTGADETVAAATRHNLPHQTTSFIGRQGELAELDRLLADPDARLITILAPGGMGKTRLALAAAKRQLHHFPDGVFFVPLAPLSNPNDIVTAIAENVGFNFYGSDPPVRQLLDYFRERNTLLVLDNFEHLLEGAPLVTDIIQAAPQVDILATSRERLNLHGETVYSLRGLHFPTWETPEDALEYDAVKLFMQSAQRVRPDFELRSADLDFLARICRLTAGMPLGIVLAAGWLDTLSLERIADEIQLGIDILETEQRDVPERQRSVRATFNYSWARLTEVEQNVFMKLSVFRGGFTPDAAQAVAGADVRLLRRLVSKALVQALPDGRYDIHELLRQYGAGKLAETDELAATQAQHMAFFADFMAERKQDIITDQQFEALAHIDPDFENVRLAWLHTVDRQQWEQMPKFLHSLWFYCMVRPRAQDGVDLLERAVHALQAEPCSRVTDLALGRVLARLGYGYNDVGFFAQGAATCDEAIRILRQHDSPEDLIAALHNRLPSAITLNQPEVAMHVTQESLQIARSIGNEFWEGWSLIHSAWASDLQGDFEQERQFAEQGLAAYQKRGACDLWNAYYHLGTAHKGLKQYEQAKHWLERSLMNAQRFGHAAKVAMNNTHLAEIAFIHHDYATARKHLRQALQAYWDAGYRWLVSWPIVFIAQACADQNDPTRAVEILATIHAYLNSVRNTDQMAEALREELETKLEPEHFAAAWARGQDQELGALVAELLAELETE